jgi:hypothetical protein
VQRLKDDQLEKETLEKRQKSEELQAFLEDQVAQVFQTYLRDYFRKETDFVRSVQSSFIWSLVSPDNRVSGPDYLQRCSELARTPLCWLRAEVSLVHPPALPHLSPLIHNTEASFPKLRPEKVYRAFSIDY